MEIVADENIDQPIIDRIRSAGHSVFTIHDNFSGIDDDSVLAISFQRNAILITEDMDFGRLIFHQGQTARGVLLVRMVDVTSGITTEQIALLILDVVKQYGNNLFGQFTVLNDRGVRQRKLP